MYSFLMIGQSNMAGRGFKDEVLAIENDRLYVLRNGRWQHIYFPVNNDRRFSGVSLVESFADECSRYYGVNVGLIPCADGGTSLAQWQPGEILYDHAVFQAKLAQRTSTIAGVLWHQGESDCGEERYPFYEEKCIHIFESMKRELGLSDEVPFIVGGLASYLAERGGDLRNYIYINETLQKMEQKNDYIGFASAEGLTSNPDCIHFNAKSLREFGVRYFEKFKQMNKVIESGTVDSFVDNLTELERL